MGRFDPKTWLDSAREDLRWVEVSMKGEVYFGACFAAQQAVEKALKAYLFACGEKLKKVHDLVMLLDDASKFDNSFQEFRKDVAVLSQYYVEVRYPDIGDYGNQTEQQTDEALNIAKEIVSFVEGKIKE